MNKAVINKRIREGYEKELTKLTSEISLRAHELSEIVQAIDSEKVKKRELQNDCNKIESEARIFTGHIVESEKKIKEIQDKMGSEILRHDENLLRITKEVDSLETVKNRLVKDTQTKKSEIKVLNSKLDEKDKVKLSIIELHKEKSSLDSEIAKSKKQLDKQNTELEKTKKECLDIVNKIQRESENIDKQYDVIKFYARRLVKYFVEIKSNVPQELQDIKPIKIFKSLKLINRIKNV